MKRASAAERGYGGKWPAARAEYLRANPWCVMCAARDIQEAATHVDHIKPHKRDFSSHGLFWNRRNWQGLCETDHNGPKQAQEKSGFLRGCDAEGNPLDGAHHWNRGSGKPTLADRIALAMPSGLLPSMIPLTIVYGPPASGKTRYVGQNAGPIDLVIDFDVIQQEVSGLGWYEAGEEWIAPTLVRRNELLASLSGEPDYSAAWFIATAPLASDRRKWEAMLQPKQVIMLAVPAKTCIARIAADPRRTAYQREHAEQVAYWWRRYEQG